MPEKVGRGERIRTSGPCLPKKAADRVTRGNLPFCGFCAAERARNIGLIPASFTGATPERDSGLAA